MFLLNKKVQNVYTISKEFTSSKNYDYEEIEICNNEEFILDLEKVKFSSNLTSVNNVELNKIFIDWGDGIRESFGRTINVSSLGKMTNSQQRIIKHVFNKVDSSKSNIIINLYNTIGDKVTIKIPYTIINRSLYDLGTNFKLLQANVSNRNLTQFVMKEEVNDSIIIVSEKDWTEL